MHSDPPTARSERKSRGAYYTDPEAAARLCAWAVRTADDTVLDPSFGAGVFLRSAACRLRSLGGSPLHVRGVEIDPEAYAAGSSVARGAGIPIANLEQRDFFADGFGSGADARFDAVVGNPPYIRFQRFAGADRERAAARAREAGVDLSPLASSWAAFLIHGANLLGPGGRLAMLVPNEIGGARYGREVLSFLAGAFERVTFVAFRDRLFPELDQDTLAVLAEGRGGEGGRLSYARAEGTEDLELSVRRATPLDVQALADGTRSMRFAELSSPAAELYDALERDPGVVRMSAVAGVTSGYVTGANGFFHLSPDRARELGIPEGDLRRAVFRSKALTGLALRGEDWRSAATAGSAGFLLTPAEPLSDATRTLLRRGEREGAGSGYKTRSRDPWYRVPRVLRPDMLMAAMASRAHALTVNAVGAAPANTLHAVTLEAGAVGSPFSDGVPLERRAMALATAWHSTLSVLSRELEGRVLGGGMLKIEPGEAGRILLPGLGRADAGPLTQRAVPELAREIDAHLRAGRHEAARGAADRFWLQDVLGLSAADIGLLTRATDRLFALRKRPRRQKGP